MITVEFKDLEEMKLFARQLIGTQPAKPAATMLPSSVSQQSVPAVSIPIPQRVPVTAPQPAPAPVPPPAPAPEAPSVEAMTPPAAPVTVPAASYALDDLARAAMTLMDSGRQGDLLGLLKQFGVDALPALPQAMYGAFATALRGMGARI